MGLLSFGKKPIEQLIKEGVKTPGQLKQVITEACTRGAVHVNLYLDAHGPEKQPTEDVLIELISKLTKEKGVLYCKGEIESSMETEKLHSSFATVEIVTSNFNHLVKIFLRYAPASLEILEPNDKLSIPIKEAQDILLDAGQSTQMYSSFVLQSSMTAEQKADFQERLKRKAEYGLKMRESGQAKETDNK